MTKEQESLLRRIDRKLSLLLQEQGKEKPPKWVNVTVVTRLTGWDPEKLRQARLHNTIKYRAVGAGERKTRYEYDLNSIHEIFLKQTA